MKTINSLSAGKSSSYIAVKYPADYELFSVVCLDDPKCAPKDPAIRAYANAKLDQYGYIQQFGEFIATAEDDQSLRVMMDLEQYIGREIIWVRGRSFDQILDEPGPFGGKKTRLPSPQLRYCTLEMKLYPIFLWWFANLAEKVNMRLGFRFDEFDRMEKFMNSADTKEGFRIPIECSLKGKRRQKWESFDWRYVSFPLVRDAVDTAMVGDFWKDKWVGGATIFDTPRRQIVFPEVSNCTNCPFKKAETLAIMAALHPEKMAWAAGKEHIGLGTWKDGVTYDAIIAHAKATPYTIEMLREQGAACDSGGCTD